jgi:transposase
LLIFAEAQIKTDKVDARILADLLRGRLVFSVHIAGRETRQIREVLRQRCFFVRQRTMLRNRIHRLLGGQRRTEVAAMQRPLRPQGRGASLPFPNCLEFPRQRSPATTGKEVCNRVNVGS